MQAAATDITHKDYPRAESPETADALAWAFKNKEEMVPYYFNFPALGDHEVRGRVLYAGLCHSDCMTARSLWGTCPYPACVGHETVCEVTHVGTKVTTCKVGEIVGFGPLVDCCNTCDFCKAGKDNLCSTMSLGQRTQYPLRFGGYATHIQNPEWYAVKIPSDMDLSNIPPLFCAGVTVFGPMQRLITQPEKTRIAVLGIGGLGHLAVQYGNKMGCQVAGFTTTKEKEEYIKKIGGHEVIVVDNDLKELEKHHNKFDFLINTLPISDSKIFDAYMKTLKNEGAIIQVGLPSSDTQMSFGFGSLVARQLSIHGSICGSIKECQDTVDFAHKHGIRVETEMFSFEDFPKAFDRMENGRPFFRCVVNVKDFNDKHFPKTG